MNRSVTKQKVISCFRFDLLICLALFLTTMACYWQVETYDYVNFDDPDYVADNVIVKRGISQETIIWAFKTTKNSNWHPLTWISYLLDVHFFGSTPGVHHLINLLFHAANAVLLFIVFRRMGAGTWPSAIVSALFAIHPLHVESVVWISERKDVLSTLFWILTMWCYTGYTTNKDIKRYLGALVLFSFGLMAKPMLVTLPFILLLLDYWPLDRLHLFREQHHRPPPSVSIIFPLIWEKIPFFVITTASSVVTYMAQKSGGALQALDSIPFNLRLANAFVSYIGYLKKIIWPYPLAVFYPYPSYHPWWKTIGSLLLMITISYLAFRHTKRHPYILVGWLWYIGSLVPVIGIIQVGFQAMADRYTYVPAIGIFIIFAWGANEFFRHWPINKAVIVTGTLLLFAALSAATWFQKAHWKDSITLFEHAIVSTKDNYLAHINLASYYAQTEQFNKAILHYAEALRVKPGYTKAHNYLGLALIHKGRYHDAIQHFSKALRLDPNYAESYNNLGLALIHKGQYHNAVRQLSKALLLNPDYAEAHNNLGSALAEQGKWDEALKHYRKAIQLKPRYAEAHNNLATILVKQGKVTEAISHYCEAVDIDPNFESAMITLAFALAQQGQFNEAVVTLEKGLERLPDSANLNSNLGMLHHASGNLDMAVVYYRKAISLRADHAEALNNLAIIFVQKKEFEKALKILKNMVNLFPDHSETYYNIASLYAQLNKVEDSIQWLHKAIERGYNNWEMIKTDQHLENIRNTKAYQTIIGSR